MSLDNALMPVPSVGGLVLLTGRAALVQSSCTWLVSVKYAHLVDATLNLVRMIHILMGDCCRM